MLDLGDGSVISKSEINRAGSRLREFFRDGDLEDETAVSRALDIVQEFRASFQYPLTKTAVGVRQFVQQESSTVIVAQRLKRLPKIIEKLARMPDTKLARMEDVGGCRAVLANRAEVERVRQRIEARWEIIRPRDYIATPKDTGYRAIHLVVERSERRIEIQLRTIGQQQWAEAVERVAGRWGLSLKDGDGPPDLLMFFRLAAEGIALIEEDVPVDDDFFVTFAEARRKVSHYFQGS